MRAAAQYRSRARLPVITYLHRSGAVLTRSSQPMVGISQKKCIEDDLLLNYYRTKGEPASDRYSNFFITQNCDTNAVTAIAFEIVRHINTQDSTYWMHAAN